MAKKKRSTKSGKGKGKDEKDLAKKRAKAAAGEKAGKQKNGGGKGTKGTGAKGTGGTPAPAAPSTLAVQAAAGAGQRPEGAGTTGSAQQPSHEPVDQVAVLKLALRDTEAKLVAAEHRLHQVQQQLDDERRALAEATRSSVEEQEAVVDTAVAETVAEAVVAAEVAAVTASSGDERPAAEVAATTLEGAANAIEAALATAADPGGPSSQHHAARNDLTPPLPERGPDTEPNESWTLVHLRKEAERRGITGISNLPKAALVELLRS